MVDYYHLLDTYPEITQFFLSNQGFFIIFPFFIIMISIVFIFLLEVIKGMIPGILGFVLYTTEEISVMFVSTRALILRIFVLVFYFCIQVCLIYLILKPNEKEIGNIKKVVIDMSDKYTITTIKEISEKTKSDHDVVIKIVKNLITDGDINADLFRRSKKLAFYK